MVIVRSNKNTVYTRSHNMKRPNFDWNSFRKTIKNQWISIQLLRFFLIFLVDIDATKVKAIAHVVLMSDELKQMIYGVLSRIQQTERLNSKRCVSLHYEEKLLEEGFPIMFHHSYNLRNLGRHCCVWGEILYEEGVHGSHIWCSRLNILL